MASMIGRTIAITGGGSGIGLATAKLLVSRGAAVALADINKDSLATAAASIRSSHGKVYTHVVDTRDRSSIRDFLKSAKQEFGKLNGAANMAGVIGRNIGRHSIWQLASEEYDFVMDVNSKGVFNSLAEELAPGVLEEDGASSIVNAASIAGLIGMVQHSAYVASKHAVIGMTRTAAKEAGSRGIRVNCVAPGTIDTPMVSQAEELIGVEELPISHTAIKRKGTAEEVANVIAFLLSQESSFVTGATYNVDGGWAC